MKAPPTHWTDDLEIKLKQLYFSCSLLLSGLIYCSFATCPDFSQECLAKPWKVYVVESTEKTTPAPGIWLRGHEGSRRARLWWWVAGKKPCPGWERCSRVMHTSFVHSGQVPKHLDCAGLGAGIASHVAGIWPSSSRGTCIFRMQTYF